MESGKESGVDGQRFAIGGRVVDADDPQQLPQFFSLRLAEIDVIFHPPA